MEAIVSELFAQADLRDPLLPLWALEWIARTLLYLWLFAFGATVGSFLNVVVYRLPRGKNLAIPGSSCPHCGHPIRLSDNVPILSWLALRGRCRDCGGRISPRYLAVEALVAATFLIVLAGEYWLPPLVHLGVMRRPLTPYDIPAFWIAYALHAALVTTLYGAVLIAADGFRVPGRLYGPIMVAALAFPLAWPEIRTAPALGRYVTGWQAGLLDGLAGLAVGSIVGMMAAALSRRRAWPSIAPAWLSASSGLVFGWQTTLWLAPLTLAACWLAAAGIQAIGRAFAVPSPEAPEPVTTTELAATAGVPSNSDSLSEEVHIVSPPTEPTEPS